jgi:hypothetical protein
MSSILKQNYLKQNSPITIPLLTSSMKQFSLFFPEYIYCHSKDTYNTCTLCCTFVTILPIVVCNLMSEMCENQQCKSFQAYFSYLVWMKGNYIPFLEDLITIYPKCIVIKKAQYYITWTLEYVCFEILMNMQVLCYRNFPRIAIGLCIF